MLGRTANDLFWMSRYMERAENIARLLEVGYRIALLPREGHGEHDEWRSTLRGAGCEEGYLAKYGSFATRDAVNFMLFDPANSSSVYSCLATARHNARAQRTALTREMWEALNGAWLEFSSQGIAMLAPTRWPLLEWIKQRSALFAARCSQLRNNTSTSPSSARSGRADNTAAFGRKYYVLLPHNEMVGGNIDTVQWAPFCAPFRHRSYRWVYRDSYKPWQIAYLILTGKCHARLVIYEEVLPPRRSRPVLRLRKRPAGIARETLRQLTEGHMDASSVRLARVPARLHRAQQSPERGDLEDLPFRG